MQTRILLRFPRAVRRGMSRVVLGLAAVALGFASTVRVVAEETVVQFNSSTSINLGQLSTVGANGADFTIEFWVKPAAVDKWRFFNNANNYRNGTFGPDTATRIRFYDPTVSVNLSTFMESGVWQHLAVTRANNAVRGREDGSIVFVNGLIQATDGTILQEAQEGHGGRNPHPDFADAKGRQGGSDGSLTPRARLRSKPPDMKA